MTSFRLPWSDGVLPACLKKLCVRDKAKPRADTNDAEPISLGEKQWQLAWIHPVGFGEGWFVEARNKFNARRSQTESHLSILQTWRYYNVTESTQMRLSSLMRYYIPIVSLLGLLFFGFLAQQAEFDPLAVAQNPRLQFQSAASNSSVNGLTIEETLLAQSVLTSTFTDNIWALRVLYVGNSQTMAIMDREPGDMTSPQWLQLFLARQAEEQASPIEVRLGSLPNMTMPEFVITLIAAGEQPGSVDVLVGSLVLEEWRGLGVREELAVKLDAPQVQETLRHLVSVNSDLRYADIAIVSALGPSTTESTNVVATSSTQRTAAAAELETRLQVAAESISPLFAMRNYLFAHVYLSYIDLRNRVFGITSSSVRPVPEGTYQASLELLELALRYAQAKGIHVILYLSPLRPVQPNPNLPEDVARFRREVPVVCQSYGAICRDYTDLVPEKLWTNYPDDYTGTGGQRDFAHFTGAGHQLLARQLITDVGELLMTWARAKASRQP